MRAYCEESVSDNPWTNTSPSHKVGFSDIMTSAQVRKLLEIAQMCAAIKETLKFTQRHIAKTRSGEHISSSDPLT
jgi:hypothetical protein